MTKDEALKLALEALEEVTTYTSSQSWSPSMTRDCENAITAIREALAQLEERPWVGLTDEEIDQGLLRSNHALQTAGAWRDGVEWATKQLKEKNT